MTPLISVILPFHLDDNYRYLKACLVSVGRQNAPLEVILLDSSNEGIGRAWKEPLNYGHMVKYHKWEGESTFSKKMNKGVELSDPKSKYIMLLSDDVVLGANALGNMAEILGNQEIILNAMSNCDNGRLNYFAKWQWPQFMKLEDLSKQDEEDILYFNKYAPVMIPVQSNCFYATMIPRTVWNKVGKLDESYNTGCEDTDYCMRAANLNIPCAVTFNAFIFHFGGATSSKTLTPEETKRNHDLFHMKWGFRLVP